MKSGVTVKVDKADDILKALLAISKKDVLVGIPAENSERDDVPFGNAGIGYINERGSPAQNIPARPHLKPGVKSVEDQTLPKLKKAARLTLEGNESGANNALDKAGTSAANGVKKYLTITGFAPLADSTLKARARRGRKGAKAELARRESGVSPSSESAKPLIDTGEYRRSITHIVRNKNASS